MSKKSIFYKNPWLYINGLKLIHGENFAKRYQYMASFAKKSDLVLEPACGPAILASYLPPGYNYCGFDTNEDFINYALKKERNVYIGNVLDPTKYRLADVIVACDVLHHLNPNDRRIFINNCFTYTKRVFIICEPAKLDNTRASLLSSINNRLTEWSEKDGTGNFKTEFFLTKHQLLDQITNGFDVISASINRTIECVGEDIITVYTKENR